MFLLFIGSCPIVISRMRIKGVAQGILLLLVWWWSGSDCCCSFCSGALQQQSPRINNNANHQNNRLWSRRQIAFVAAVTLSTTTSTANAVVANAFVEEGGEKVVLREPNKLLNLSIEELKQIVYHDIQDGKFLTTGKLTRQIYDEEATFTDEIDTYGLDQWMKGTAKLFDGTRSTLRLVDDNIDVSSQKVEFRFEEDLAFRIPILNPIVHLTGKVELLRSPETGLITHYQEYWDQDVLTVLKSAKLFTS